MNSRARVAELIFAFVFLGTAVAKLIPTVFDPQQLNEYSVPPWLLVGLALVECVLSYLLVFVKARPVAYTAILSFILIAFLITAISSISKFRCGCFGPIDVNISIKLAFLSALACVAYLLPLRTELRSVYSLARSSLADPKRRLKLLNLGFILVLLCYFVGSRQGRNLAGFVDRPVRIEGGSEIELGANTSDLTCTRTLIIRNLSGETVELLGGRANCSCIKVNGPFPQYLSPYSRCEATFEIDLNRKAIGHFEHKITFFLSATGQPRMGLDIRGSIHD